MEKGKKQNSVNKEETVIKINRLYKSFDELEVLKNVNLTVYRGENVAVLGKSGSGKSVLIKIIAGLLKPDKGEVTVLGKTVDKISGKELDELRLHMGFSFQSSALYDSMSVYKNLAFPLIMNVKNLTQKQVDTAVEEALEAVGLEDKIDELPADLSGGQRKRLGIARTLILKPEIMLYDEPTSGLDPITCAEINTLIIEVQERYKTSSVIITHDLTCAKHTCDRLAMLIDGAFLKIGTFEEVLNTDEEQIKKFFAYNFIQ
ncbi:ABC transporter ATP-binding protein [Flavobacterium psychrotolerans]|uniref:ABC transporter ATP-binding protein n=1 Tax=Flavobacterium psychrotolerans TaxID=2169410 RepID=A0A2U1JGH0_9FLAO|nr:ATP-binding cassette domain-containing protein [Flavobacterium psychrotolerans]PWA04221.1 ABC transporter ATP-binding protein [Flavobacterium psychrotolerans]